MQNGRYRRGFNDFAVINRSVVRCRMSRSLPCDDKTVDDNDVDDNGDDDDNDDEMSSPEEHRRSDAREKTAKQIANTRESIRRKHRALKSGAMESEIALEKRFKPIVAPLKQIVKQTETKKQQNPPDRCCSAKENTRRCITTTTTVTIMIMTMRQQRPRLRRCRIRRE